MVYKLMAHIKEIACIIKDVCIGLAMMISKAGRKRKRVFDLSDNTLYVGGNIANRRDDE